MQDERGERGEQRRSIAPWQAALSSLIVPGSGQFLNGERTRGLSVLGAVVILAALVLWWQTPLLLMPVAAIWLWNVIDAYFLVSGREIGTGVPIVLGALVIYVIGFSAVQFRPDRLQGAWQAIRPFANSLVNPELFTYETEDLVGLEPIFVPCIDSLPEPARNPTVDPDVILSVECGEIGDEAPCESLL